MSGFSNMQLQAVRADVDSDGIVIVRIDTPGKPVNTLSPAVLKDLGEVVSALEQTRPPGVIFASAKARSFVAGADLFEIKKMNRAQCEQFLADGQALFERIARLPVPTCAAINGDCLGGGLELALACKTRVAASEGAISIGLPEVKLGILPGWGGTVRLPRLIGLASALPLLLTGKTMPPRKALKAGIIDEIVRPEALLDAAKRRLVSRAGAGAPSLAQKLAVTVPALRKRIFVAAEKKTREQTRGNYPAPMRLIDVVRTGYEKGPAAGLAAERKALGDLMDSEACRNLMRLFFLRQGAKRSIFEHIQAKPAEVTYAAVVGGGIMGSGIICGLVRAGVRVRLVEVDAKAVSGALGRIRKLLDEDVYAGRMSALESKHAFNRVAPTCEWTGLGLAEVVIEAVAEQMDVKRQVFAKLDRLTRPDAILASNTSSLSITEMAESTAHPHRVVGLHFFNPVPKMPLVEVVRTPASDDRALATATGLALRMGKTPILVKDAPGFLVNRVLIPYLAESLTAAVEGAPITAIDRALKDWGMPMGPFELLDEIGLDIAAHVLNSLGDRFGGHLQAPAGLTRATERGWLGKKSGRGFYVHEGTKRGAEPPVNSEMLALLTGRGADQPSSASAMPDDEIQWRLVLPMVNEAAKLLSEHVTDSVDAIDLGTVLGLGLAPFRGGLAHFADAVGTGQIVQRLEVLSTRHGNRFAPAPLLRQLALGHRPLAQFAEVGEQPEEPASRPTVEHAGSV